MSAADNSIKIKNAASLLVRGGTLTGEPCEKCGGVLIRFRDKITCISCGAETLTDAVFESKANAPTVEPRSAPSDLRSCAEVIEQKIVKLAAEIGAENDLLVQKQKADLLETYLRILEKVKAMSP